MTDPSGAFLAPVSTTLTRHLVNLVLVREQLMKVVSRRALLYVGISISLPHPIAR